MMTKIITFAIAISLSIITVLADYFIKNASLEKNLRNKWLLVGAIIYGLTAIGRVFVMRNMKLSTLGVVYGVSCIGILALLSVFVFHEKINTWEIIGICMGLASIGMLYRFS